jgi:branched-subunit amino acid aminotransferase/4-amino-4-deoxychorismate lyase
VRLRDEAALRVDDSAFLEGRGHYTTALVRDGNVCWLRRHVARLKRDSQRMGFGRVDEFTVCAAFADLAKTAFGSGSGAIRLQHSRDASGATHWVGLPRSLGEPPATWRAVRARFPHEGPQPWSGVKMSGSLLYAWAHDAARSAAVEDALLVDAVGRLIEGARSNLVVLLESGELVTPDLARGGVAGMAREVLLDHVPELRVRDVAFETLAGARGLLAINSLRGARPIVELDSRPVAAPPAELVTRLNEVLAGAE